VQERGSEGPSPFLSICIPSYNRPELLARLLRSIDVPGDTVEIVICEDMAPNRERVREEVQEFQASTPYRVRYFENTQNLGYDRNLRELIGKARGEFIVFMGDDDRFVPGKLDDFIGYLRSQPDVGYVLRSYLVEHDDGRSELFRYFPRSERFEQGFDELHEGIFSNHPVPGQEIRVSVDRAGPERHLEILVSRSGDPAEARVEGLSAVCTDSGE